MTSLSRPWGPEPVTARGAMPRGGRAKDRAQGPERRCIATGQSGPRARLIRFVLGPGGVLVPDLAGRLPGRGVWLTADRDLVAQAIKRRAFSRAFRTQVTVPDDLAGLLEQLLVRRLVEAIALARKAGVAVTGYEKVRARLAAGQVGVLVAARDAAAGGRAKLAQIGSDRPVIAALDAAELGLAFGRDFAIHAALGPGGFASRALFEADRLTGLRSGAPRDSVPLPGGALWPDDPEDDSPVQGAGERGGDAAVDAPADDSRQTAAVGGAGPGDAGRERAADDRTGSVGGHADKAKGPADAPRGAAALDDAGQQGSVDGPGQDD